ncbi:alpha-1,2-fucosyltransferase [Bacillus sp. FJAT-28004]|uniref:alpha-1,2-fucosyltransferase n=1 Tax=Bacillus sp. FJAT-28004 TaxID=1679165 RepID=UPI0006B65E7B|nr:alpha-1,2-fucosyltransferase [Bacillus sp. FJAT-28004]
MVILKLIGGLGNQMFEIAFARVMALESKSELFIDTSVYKRYKIRSYSLPHLVISDSVRPLEESKLSKSRLLCMKISQQLYRVYQKAYKVISKKDKIGKGIYKFLVKQGLHYNFDRYYYSDVMSNKKVKYIYGYFQSEKYFKEYKSIIVKELKVKTKPTKYEEELLDEITKCNSVGVSIRLGDDYINSASLNVCNHDYYYRAMDLMYEKNKNVVFFIFSDCIDRVKEQFNFKYNVCYVDGFKDYESLRLLYSCSNFIISNSSFSWWGAYLSDNDSKIIVSPSKWYNDSFETPDIYNNSMMLLRV